MAAALQNGQAHPCSVFSLPCPFMHSLALVHQPCCCNKTMTDTRNTMPKKTLRPITISNSPGDIAVVSYERDIFMPFLEENWFVRCFSLVWCYRLEIQSTSFCMKEAHYTYEAQRLWTEPRNTTLYEMHMRKTSRYDPTSLIAHCCYMFLIYTRGLVLVEWRSLHMFDVFTYFASKKTV